MASGSIESVEIAGRGFAVAADADSGRSLGGFTVEVQPNGDGSARIVATRIPWKVGGLTVQIDDDRGDLEFLQDVVDAKEFVPITVTYASGISYGGLGIPVGEFDAASMAGTAPLELKGPKKLTPQA